MNTAPSRSRRIQRPGAFWVNDNDFPRLVAEARTLDSLRRKVADMLDTTPSKVELRLRLPLTGKQRR